VIKLYCGHCEEEIDICGPRIVIGTNRQVDGFVGMLYCIKCGLMNIGSVQVEPSGIIITDLGKWNEN